MAIQLSSFARYISIVSSDARTTPDGTTALRVFLATPTYEPVEVPPPAKAARYWTRTRVADWLLDRLTTSIPTLVGIDNGFSLPLAYFASSRLTGNWDEFLETFTFQSPAGRYLMPLDLVLCREAACGAPHPADSHWDRLTEIRAGIRSPLYSPAGSLLWKSTCAGIHWLASFRRRVSPRVHCWPFDGWTVTEGHSALVETYPDLWRERFPEQERNADQCAAYVAAAWMRQADASGSLQYCFQPELSDAERSRAKVEGWILGVQ